MGVGHRTITYGICHAVKVTAEELEAEKRAARESVEKNNETGDEPKEDDDGR